MRKSGRRDQQEYIEGSGGPEAQKRFGHACRPLKAFDQPSSAGRAEQWVVRDLRPAQLSVSLSRIVEILDLG